MTTADRLRIERDILETAIAAEVVEFCSGTSMQGLAKIGARFLAKCAVDRAIREYQVRTNNGSRS